MIESVCRENMKVDVISCTSDIDIVKAWIASRSQFLSLSIQNGKYFVIDNVKGTSTPVDEYVKELIKMDLGFNYFAHITLRIYSSILLREFFYSFSQYRGKWAETARYSNPKILTLSNEVEGLFNNEEEACNDYIEAVADYENHKTSQFDKTREKMPLSTQRMFQISLPIKMLIRILGQLSYICTKSHNPKLMKMWRKVWYAFSQVEELRNWLPLIGKYSGEDTELSLKYQEREVKSHKIGYVGMVLYSQLIRHEGIRVLGFEDFLLDENLENLSHPDCGTRFKIIIEDQDDRMKDIVRLRTSWFAVTDGDWKSEDSCNSWGCILKKFLKGNLQRDKKYLKYFKKVNNKYEFDPDSVDEYSLDDDLRLHKGYNAYFPDAFALESRKILEDRIARYGMNPLMSCYLEMFDQGFVADNPNNEKRKKWEELCQ